MKRILPVLVGALWLVTSCASQTTNTSPQYYRVKHDSQLAAYNYQARTADEKWFGVGPQTPEVVPLFIQPKLSAGTNRTKLNGKWETMIDGLNDNNESKLAYLKADNSALFNSAGFPQLESLTMGGNVVTVDEIQGSWGRVQTLDSNNPPDFKEVNYVTRPDMVHKFVVVGWKGNSKETYWTNPPKGDLYLPLVSSRPLWIPLENLEKFPDLPIVVTANTTLNPQSTPGTNIKPIGLPLFAGQSAKVIEYYPSASNVWGRLERGGWILLLSYVSGDDAPQYSTSWQMETWPPPPPQ